MALRYPDDEYYPKSLHSLLEGTEAFYSGFKSKRIFPINENGEYETFSILDPTLNFTVDGLNIIPCRMGSVVEMQRGFGERMLSIFRQLKKEFVPKEVDKTVYITQGPEELIREVLPKFKYRKLGNSFVIEIPKEEPIFVEQKDRGQNFGLVNIDRRNEVDNSILLTQEMRARIQECGKIVYEGDSRGKDRLLVCVKWVHGSSESFADFSSIDSKTPQTFKRHQQAISQLSDSELSPDKDSLFFLESFPRKNHSKEEAEKFQFFTQNAVALFQGLQRYRSSEDPAIRLVVESFDCDWQAHFLRQSIINGKGGNIYGDGRNDLEESLNSDKELLRSYTALLKEQGGTHELYKKIDEIKKRRNKKVVHDSNRALAMEIAKNQKAGQTAFVVYGGGHFSSGYSNDRDHPLEEYLTMIPSTQVIVVEPKGYQEIVESLSRKIYNLTSPLMLSNEDIRNEMKETIEKMRYLLQTFNDKGFNDLAQKFYMLSKRLQDSVFVPTPEQPKPPKIKNPPANLIQHSFGINQDGPIVIDPSSKFLFGDYHPLNAP